ncbi:hypothetical protein BVH74_15895 [Halopseudomonas phragmitis]|uniref:Spermidine synthase n=2 Tax=Halopseudomonas phragmitis TaxID=1931241 RepID=A0A1V0B8A0_9GAMM|nr:hypothetical protein BVH74_15895 [Halopseudomonas phragmitis]
MKILYLLLRRLLGIRRHAMTTQENVIDCLRDDFGMLRVTESGLYRFLYFGEKTEQSCCYVPDSAWLEYDYTRAMLLGLYWCRADYRATLLGLGGGSLANCLVRYFQPERVTAVELRPAVVELARKWLGLSSDPCLQVLDGCAERYINQAPESCDLLMVDLYMEGGLSRLQLQTEFFQSCHRALRPGGLMVINQWQMGETGQPYAAEMLRELFGDDYLCVEVDEGNILLFIPAGGRLTLDKDAMRLWADDQEPRLGYSLRPYIESLRRAG